MSEHADARRAAFGNLTLRRSASPVAITSSNSSRSRATTAPSRPAWCSGSHSASPSDMVLPRNPMDHVSRLHRALGVDAERLDACGSECDPRRSLSGRRTLDLRAEARRTARRDRRGHARPPPASERSSPSAAETSTSPADAVHPDHRHDRQPPGRADRGKITRAVRSRRTVASRRSPLSGDAS